MTVKDDMPHTPAATCPQIYFMMLEIVLHHLLREGYHTLRSRLHLPTAVMCAHALRTHSSVCPVVCGTCLLVDLSSRVQHALSTLRIPLVCAGTLGPAAGMTIAVLFGMLLMWQTSSYEEPSNCTVVGYLPTLIAGIADLQEIRNR